MLVSGTSSIPTSCLLSFCSFVSSASLCALVLFFHNFIEFCLFYFHSMLDFLSLSLARSLCVKSSILVDL